MKKLRVILSLLIALLGLAHMCFTPVFYPGWTLDSLWFASTGIALIFMGLANYLLIGRNETWLRICGAVANFSMLTILAMVAVIIGGAPHALVGVALALGLFVAAAVDGPKGGNADGINK